MSRTRGIFVVAAVFAAGTAYAQRRELEGDESKSARFRAAGSRSLNPTTRTSPTLQLRDRRIVNR
jgi:hypothetical protein